MSKTEREGTSASQERLRSDRGKRTKALYRQLRAILKVRSGRDSNFRGPQGRHPYKNTTGALGAKKGEFRSEKLAK